MKKTIIVGGEPLKFEATTGTGELYQMFTGGNIYNDLQELSKAFKGGFDDPNKVSMGDVNKALSLVKKMGFVMYTQANTEGNTNAERIRNIKEKLNEDEYLGWLLGIDNNEFNGELFNQLLELMNLNSKTYVEPKNLAGQPREN